VSDEDDVRAQLENTPFVKEGTLNYSLTEQAGVPLIMFSWRSPSDNTNRIYLRDGKVLRIEIELDYDLTLSRIVEKYGPPQSVYAFVGPTDTYWLSISFDYPAIGLTLESFSVINPAEIVDGAVVVSEDTKITRAYYYAPTSLQDMLSEVFLFSPDWVKYHLANSQEWRGFGPVKLAGQRKQ